MSTGVLCEGSRRGAGRDAGTPNDEVREQAETRGVRIRKSILERVGYTAGCPTFKATELENEYKMRTSHHTRTCRQRVEEKMMEFPDLIERLRPLMRGKRNLRVKENEVREK